MHSDCLVLGGGIIGCSTAWRLAERGARVTLIERGEPGQEATWAAGGILAPQAEAHGPGPFLDLALASRARYPRFVAEVEEASGLPVGLRTDGTLVLAHDAEKQEELQARVTWQRRAGLPVEELDQAALAALEPGLAPARFALRFPDDHQVDNRLLARALLRAAERAGVRIVRGEATRLLEDGGRLSGVELAGGERLACLKVVVACGSWSSQLGGIGLAPDAIAPVRGQMIELETRPEVVRHVVFGQGGYLVPRKDGRLLVGSTQEWVGFVKEVTPEGRKTLAARAASLSPLLAGHPIARAWSGFRPASPDGLPLLGAGPLPGLIVATGHFRNGILLAPITAEIACALAAGTQLPVDIQPFSPARLGIRHAHPAS